jgi:hypothetical protein
MIFTSTVVMSRISSLFSAFVLVVSVSLVSALTSGASQFEEFYAFPTGSGTTCTTLADHCSLETAPGLINSNDTDILGANLNASFSLARARAVQQYLHHLLAARGYGAVQIFADGAGVNLAAPHSDPSRKVVVSLLA